MDEINVAAAFDAAKQGTLWLHDFELVPTNLRHFQSVAIWKSDDAAVKDSEPGGAAVEFFALVEKGLVADANSKKRTS